MKLILLFTFLFISTNEQVSEFSGMLLDASSSEPVAHAYLHLEEINRSATSGRDGSFRFNNVPAGVFTLHIHRIGYETQKIVVQLNGVDSRKIVVNLKPLVFNASDLIISGIQERGLRGNVEHASVKILGQELRRNLGTTLSQTLQNIAGFSERSMGPAPGRPVIRGLDGERVLILRDGQRTGDVSTTSPDHAVTIDPLMAEEIQIARGPASLAFGGSAVGGVVNVVQHAIPTSLPTRVSGNISIYGKSVNSEAAISGQFLFPVGNMAAKLNLNLREGLDLRTPQGRIKNTYLRSTNNTIGLSRITPWGYYGGSLNFVYSDYGIPPDPEAGHPEGVDISMVQLVHTIRAEYLLENSFFKIIEPEFSISYYNHKEYEANGSIGTEYDQYFLTTNLKTRHKAWGIFNSGLIGGTLSLQDYSVYGARTPASNQLNGGVFTIQETDFGPLHLEFGTRVDLSLSIPKQERESPIIGKIRSRKHTGLASSASAIYNVSGNWYTGATLLHSFRAPSLEELYSEGPHLAAYSFEIGNPELDQERGFAKEFFIRYQGTRSRFKLTGYRNYFWNFIFPEDTGRPNFRLPDLNDFQFTQAEAIFLGVELAADISIFNGLNIGMNTFFTKADRRLTNEEQVLFQTNESVRPLPNIPPLMGTAFAQYRMAAITLRGQVRFATTQNRIAAFENKTDGYALFDANIQYVIQHKGVLHTLSLNAENIYNTLYRNHLSRVKHIFPEPGRNISLLYRVYF